MVTMSYAEVEPSSPLSVTAATDGHSVFVKIVNTGKDPLAIMLLPLGHERYGIESRLTEDEQRQENGTLEVQHTTILSESHQWSRNPARYIFLDKAGASPSSSSLSLEIKPDSIPEDATLKLSGFIPYAKRAEMMRFESMGDFQDFVRKNGFEFSVDVASDTRIRASSVGIETILIGSLGYPLGADLRVKARVAMHHSEHHKDSTYPVLHIIEVDGKKLPEEVTLPIRGNTPSTNGQATEMTIMETGEFSLEIAPNLGIGDNRQPEQRLRTWAVILSDRAKN
ncbi:MAG: hypothetical protein BGO12_06100 [Verrucomicrobia bacterium 61-8]|nr:MAG: hypothetical protein BGO12_06100 [Verrucomicrobia bacterium 61-8]